LRPFWRLSLFFAACFVSDFAGGFWSLSRRDERLRRAGLLSCAGFSCFSDFFSLFSDFLAVGSSAV